MADAVKAYEKYVVCLDKTPEKFEAAVTSLLAKAIKAYETRGPQMRHGIALDRHVTIILSQSEGVRPLCGIYLNLYSPYQKQVQEQGTKTLPESIGGPPGKPEA